MVVAVTKPNVHDAFFHPRHGRAHRYGRWFLHGGWNFLHDSCKLSTSSRPAYTPLLTRSVSLSARKKRIVEIDETCLIVNLEYEENRDAVFNIHINGVPHCSVRYRQFHNFFEQLKREFGANAIPPFPPKKWLSLTPLQLEERRLGLEKFIQQISQEHAIATSNTFNHFLLSAQQETLKEKSENVVLDVYLMDGNKVTVNITSTDQRDDVLEAVAAKIDLLEEFVYYFGLFLIKEVGQESEIIRKLQEFESPYISMKTASHSQSHSIALRKSYWDATYDDELVNDRIAMNLLYIQAVSDIERGWVITNKEQQKQLSLLRQRGSKKEFLLLARTLKYYGYLQFRPCYTDFSSGTRVLISAGNKELIFRQQASGEVKEITFRVTRMRCWRITSTVLEEDMEAAERRTSPTDPLPCHLELAFEYLFGKDNLKWVTIKSDQAILMSMSLQGMVDELIQKKSGERMKRPQDRRRIRNGSCTSHLKKEASSYSLKSPTASTPEAEAGGLLGKETTIKAISDKISAVTLKGPTLNQMNDASGLMTENDAFEGIGDDDL